MTNIINISILLCVIVLLSQMNDYRRILWMISLSYFPLILTFMGRDALAVSTLSVYLFGCAFIVKRVKLSESLKRPVNVLILLLALIAGISTLSVPRGELTGPAFRRYAGFISSLLLFFYVSNLDFDNEEQRNEYVEKLLAVTLVMISIQVIISILVYKFPAASKFLDYFRSAKSEGLKIEEGERALSLIFTPESYGEFLAVICPVALYKVFYRNSIWYSSVFVLFCFGLIASQTRSGVILFALATSMFFLYGMRKRRFGLLIPFLFGAAGLLFLSLIPGFVDSLSERFLYAYNAYQEGSDFSAIVNRSNVWNLDYVLAKLNLFGHGLVPPYYYGEIDSHLHNLYQTVLFQYGVIGFVCFFAVFFLIIKRLIQSLRDPGYKGNKALVFSSIVSLLIFFANECKYEFNRSEAYQQLCWALFAGYYLISRETLAKQ